MSEPRKDVLGDIGRRLSGLTGRELWRSLDELADTPEFRAAMRREFPLQASFWEAPFPRKDFLKLMGASLALGGLAACGKPPDRILPYAEKPEGLIEGVPRFYATTLPRGGFARGALVKSAMGRPVKVEGNPAHPASLGATDAFMQADLLGLYDPDRAQEITEQGRPSTWEAFQRSLSQALLALGPQGEGLRLLTGAVTSPFLVFAIDEVLRRYPKARWHVFEPVSRAPVYEGLALAFGTALDRRYDLAKADVVVALDADLFMEEPGSLAYARQFAARRRPDEPMTRLYAAEPSPTLLGSRADHRLAAPPSVIPALAFRLARLCGLPVAETEVPAVCEPWLRAAADDLKRARGKGLVAAGLSQPPAVHALAAFLNDALDNAGRTVHYLKPPEATVAAASLAALLAEAAAGQVQTLLIFDVNPVYSLPAAGMRQALERVPFAVYAGLYPDETAEGCRWQLPRAHPLESWGDALAFDGTASLIQPLIAPLYGGIADSEVLGAVLGRQAAPHDELRAFWSKRGLSGETDWDDALRRGLIAGTTAQASERRPRRDALSPLLPPASGAGGREAVLRPDLRLWDGRYANNGWLQEFPDPVSRLTWDNAAWISPALSKELDIAGGDVIEIQAASGQKVEAPAWIIPGQARDTIGLSMGGGRERGGHVLRGAGYWAETMRPASQAWALGEIQIRKTGRSIPMAGVQGHQLMEGRSLARYATLTHYREDRLFANEHPPGPEETLYGPMPQGDYAWGMSIDLNACIACGACVLACQAENNSPIVGKEEVLREREMHWIRIDRYYAGGPDGPKILSQPVPCMHCEDAPCELVCPVGATVHSDEGLNEMVYNRCVGTRYCSNNCPYKVRRFNFFAFADSQEDAYKLMRNPDVSVRSRGVMEKCTYCIQRIQEARLAADKEDRLIGPDEVVTACQQACPAEAIVFGNKADPKSRVAQRKASPLDYGLLAELGTRPRTTYTARVDNANETLEEGS